LNKSVTRLNVLFYNGEQNSENRLRTDTVFVKVLQRLSGIICDNLAFCVSQGRVAT